MVEMKALQSFIGTKGFVKKGQVFTVERKELVRQYEEKKLAVINYKPDEQTQPEETEGTEKEITEENDGAGDIEIAKSNLEGFKTHKEIDAYAELIEVPTDEYPTSGNLDEKRAAILDFLTK